MNWICADAEPGGGVLSGKTGADRLFGAEGRDHILGGAGQDRLSGRAGDDFLFGGEGDDVLLGGQDSDLLYGGDGDDWMHGNRGADRLNGQDRIFGGKDNDQLFGGSGDDVLHGGLDAKNQSDYRTWGLVDHTDGRAWLMGGTGQDILYASHRGTVMIGGASPAEGDGARDVFVFSKTPSHLSWHIVRRFEDGVNQLDLTAYRFDSFEEDVLSRAVEKPSGVRLSLHDGGKIFLEGLVLGDLDAGDFLL